MGSEVVIKLVGLASGEPSGLEGQYLREYDPQAHEGRGHIVVTDDPKRAMIFPDAIAAMQKYYEHYGWRTDGEWNRPLTAWTVSIEAAP